MRKIPPRQQICKVCGDEYTASNKDQRKSSTCSKPCRYKLISISRLKRNDISKLKCAECGGEFTTRDTKDYRKRKTCSDVCFSKRRSRIASEYCLDNLKNHRDKAVATMSHREQTSDPVKMGPTHWRSWTGTAVSPDGECYQVRNVQEFVRQNEHLFNPEDVVWRACGKVLKDGGQSQTKGSRRCRASGGLHGIKNSPTRSWKGWTFLPAKETE
jgi:hypothetical protein